MTLYSYVVRWDHGFAPNPFYEFCTLATCAPKIRARAKLGDYVLGTGSASRGHGGRAVFLMKVTEQSTFDAYWRDPRFQQKVPVMNGSLKQRFGDNIYHRRRPGDSWIQADSRHSQLDAVANELNIQRDTGTTDRVLLSEDFTYWGSDAPVIPARLSKFVHKARSYKSSFSEKDIARFVAWVESLRQTGCVGKPLEWNYERWWR